MGLEVFTSIIAFCLLFFLTGTHVGEHAEIMVGKLEIIFGENAVALCLGIAGHILVFFKKLCSVTTRPAINTIGTIPTTIVILARRIVATATAVALLTFINHRVAIPIVKKAFKPKSNFLYPSPLKQRFCGFHRTFRYNRVARIEYHPTNIPPSA